MKKSTKIILRIVVIPIAAIFLFFIISEITSVRVNTSFADSVFIEIEDGNLLSFSVEVESDDTNELKEIFNGKRAWPDSPSCPTGGVNIIFKSERKELILHPAGDGCSTVMVGEYPSDKYFHLSENENERVQEILSKYGVAYPFGI